ncbi:hypothetical protein ACHAWF_005996, partial [Thalassiosira exigua]
SGEGVNVEIKPNLHSPVSRYDTTTAPIALRPEQVLDELTCSICMTVPADPVLTSCEHIFCRGCIGQALKTSSQCPIDRVPCTVEKLRPLRGCLSRIWGSVPVKCGNHGKGCAWTAMQQRPQRGVHRGSEGGAGSAQAGERKVKKTLQNRLNLPPLFHGEYNFDRKNVVQLSQLISRYLESKPPQVDSARIYGCVRWCYLDLEKRHPDNPRYYRTDMKMLLATCQANTWFSDDQRQHINTWYGKQYA